MEDKAIIAALAIGGFCGTLALVSWHDGLWKSGSSQDLNEGERIAPVISRRPVTLLLASNPWTPARGGATAQVHDVREGARTPASESTRYRSEGKHSPADEGARIAPAGAEPGRTPLPPPQDLKERAGPPGGEPPSASESTADTTPLADQSETPPSAEPPEDDEGRELTRAARNK